MKKKKPGKSHESSPGIDPDPTLTPRMLVASVTLTEQSAAYVRNLLYSGLYGTSATEVMQRLIETQLLELKKKGAFK